MADDANTRLMLVGDLPAAMKLAAEMVQGSDGNVQVGTADCASLGDWCRTMRKVVVVDVTVNLPNLLERLRFDPKVDAQPQGAIEQLVGQSVEQVERALILETLQRCGGNRTAASSMLGISVRTMRNKLRSFLAEDMSSAQPLSRA